ncbi:protein kinase domain-containing protein [Salininema proteolyticum]|uniref:non-specific serine/threonine protein kinase n=1 Tax=Salininema proteolyticum TaxID=1607685 RepID=A0ABV8TYJ5_9ACTN
MSTVRATVDPNDECGVHAGMVKSRSIKEGDVLNDRYRIVRRVGGGGMGDVWEGHDGVLQRKVAVKLLLAGLSDDAGFQERFRREARAIACLKGPGIVDIYDYGEVMTEGGLVAYLVMEFIEGEPLSRMLGLFGRLPVEDTLRMVSGTAKALAVAHAGSIVHRDIKPGNIIVRPGGAVCLVDFGIARDGNANTMTTTGVVLGTVTYMSPEQAADQQLSAASDLYSLGVVAYQCLAGNPPFKADTPLQVLQAHLVSRPMNLPEDIPPAAAQIVYRCLQREVEDRWSDATALADACDRYLGVHVPAGTSRHAPGRSRRRDLAALAPEGHPTPNGLAGHPNTGFAAAAQGHQENTFRAAAPAPSGQFAGAGGPAPAVSGQYPAPATGPNRVPTSGSHPAPGTGGHPAPGPSGRFAAGGTAIEPTPGSDGPSARAPIPVTPAPSGEFAAEDRRRRRRRRAAWWTVFATVIGLFFAAGALAATASWNPADLLGQRDPGPPDEMVGDVTEVRDDAGADAGMQDQGVPDGGGDTAPPETDEDPDEEGGASPSEDSSPSEDTEPSSSPSPSDTRVEVPSVVGETIYRAEEMIKAEGLTPKQYYQGEGEHICPVSTQDPSPGTLLEKGSEVQFTARKVAAESDCENTPVE